MLLQKHLITTRWQVRDRNRLKLVVLPTSVTLTVRCPFKVVLRVMWRNHIRRFFVLDMAVYSVFFTLWIFLIDKNVSKADRAISIVLLVLNTLNVCREIWQSNFGRHLGYFSSGWNQIDIAAAALVYGYTIPAATTGNVVELVPLAIVTTLLLTMKLVSYLRAFTATGESPFVGTVNDVTHYELLKVLSLFLSFVSRRLAGDSLEPQLSRCPRLRGSPLCCHPRILGVLSASFLNQ